MPHYRKILVVAIILLAIPIAWMRWNRHPHTVVEARQEPSTAPVPSEVPDADASLRLQETVEVAEIVEVPEPSPELARAIDLERSAVATRARLEELSSAYSESTHLSPIVVLENLRTVFRQFQSRFGGNPVGTNAEIVQALNGRNPGRATFLNPEDGMQLNARGELVDNWGTPYFFHQLSATEMEIHSAGPDRRMGTADDLIVR